MGYIPGKTIKIDDEAAKAAEAAKRAEIHEEAVERRAEAASVEAARKLQAEIDAEAARKLQAEMDGEAEALRLADATPQMMQVECPRGKHGGEMLQVVEPFNGRTMQVKIPDGIEGGMVFDVQVPPPNAVTPIVVGQAAQAQPIRFVAREEPLVGHGLGEAPSLFEQWQASRRGDPSPYEELLSQRRGGKKSRKLRKRATIKGGKKSRKLRKRTTIKGGKRKRRRPRRRR